MTLETKRALLVLSIPSSVHKTQTNISKRAKALTIFNTGGEKTHTQCDGENNPRGKEAFKTTYFAHDATT